MRLTLRFTLSALRLALTPLRLGLVRPAGPPRPRRAPALLAALVAINLLLPATHVVGPVQAPITARLPALLGMPGAR